jgi:hypothetical protein
LFQNVESWNDIKRTCIPSLKPARGKLAVPGRFFYGSTEKQTNPDNTPAEAPLSTARNWNDPAPCS